MPVREIGGVTSSAVLKDTPTLLPHKVQQLSRRHKLSITPFSHSKFAQMTPPSTIYEDFLTLVFSLYVCTHRPPLIWLLTHHNEKRGLILILELKLNVGCILQECLRSFFRKSWKIKNERQPLQWGSMGYNPPPPAVSAFKYAWTKNNLWQNAHFVKKRPFCREASVSLQIVTNLSGRNFTDIFQDVKILGQCFEKKKWRRTDGFVNSRRL